MDRVRALLWKLFYKLTPDQRLRMKKILQRDGHRKSLFSSLIARRNAEGKERFDRALVVLTNDLIWLDNETKIEEVIEIGVGYVGSSLIGLALYFDARVTGVDINRLLDMGATHRAISAVPDSFALGSSLGLSPSKEIELSKLKQARGASDLEVWMSNNDIDYQAPVDVEQHATQKTAKYDLVYSRSVLEHIAPSNFETFVESIRQLSSESGYSVHFIDLTDHLSHTEQPDLFLHDLSYNAERESGWRGNALSPLKILRCFDECFAVVHFCSGGSLDDQRLKPKRRFSSDINKSDFSERPQWILIEARASAL